MRRVVAVVVVLVWAGSAGPPAAGDPSFTRAANTEAGRMGSFSFLHLAPS